MADRNRSDAGEQDRQQQDASSAKAPPGPTGDPGRTPGTAEGDEETVDQSLKQKEGGNR